MLQACIEDLLVRGLDVWIQAAEVASVAYTTEGEQSHEKRRDLSLRLIQKLLEDGLAEAGMVDEQRGFVPWDIPVDVAIQPIEGEWSMRSAGPEFGEVCWAEPHRERSCSGVASLVEEDRERKLTRYLLLCVYAMLLTPGFARDSAAADIEHEAGQTLQLHWRCEPTYDDLASDSLLAARGGKIGGKIAMQMRKRGRTKEAIDEAIKSSKQIKAVNKAIGNTATRYVHPTTGQSVIVDKVTGEIHVGGPGFKYGPGSGDVK